VIADITDAAQIRKIIACLNRHGRPPPSLMSTRTAAISPTQEKPADGRGPAPGQLRVHPGVGWLFAARVHDYIHDRLSAEISRD
jgi:hypothetical protein